MARIEKTYSKKFFFRKGSVALKIFQGLFSLSIIPIVIIGFWMINTMQKELKNSSINAFLNVAEIKKSQVDQYFENHKDYLIEFENSKGVIKGVELFDKTLEESGPQSTAYTQQYNLFYHYANSRLKRFADKALLIINPKGKVVYSHLGDIPLNTDIQSQNYKPSPINKAFKSTIANQKLTISDYNIIPDTHQRSCYMSTPIKNNGTIIGVIMIELNIVNLISIINDDIGFNETGEVLLGEKKGDNIHFLTPRRFAPEGYSSNTVSIAANIAIPMRNAILGKDGHGRSIDYRGEKTYTVWHNIKEPNLGMVVKVDETEVLQSVKRLKLLLFLVIFILLVLNVVLSILLHQSIAKPLSMIIDGLNKISGGDLSITFAQKYKGEIGQLVIAANQMSKRLRQRDEESLNLTNDILESEQNLAVTLNSIGDAIIATNLERKITLMNPVAERLTGWTIREAKGTLIDKVLRIYHAKTNQTQPNPIDLVLKTGQVHALANHTVLRNKHNKEYHIADAASPIRNIDDQLTGVILNFRDISDNYVARREMEMANRISKQALKMANAGSWYIDLKNHPDRIYATKSVYDIMGIQFDDSSTYQYQTTDWFMANALEANKSTAENISKQFDSLIRNPQKGYNVEYQAKRISDGTIIWIKSIGEIEYDTIGNPSKLYGVSQDITERKEYEDKILQSERDLRHVYNNATVSLLFVDIELGTIVDCNPTAIQMFKAESKNDIIGLSPGQPSPMYQPNGLLSTKAAKLVIQEAIQNTSSEFEWVHETFTGDIIHCDIKLSKVMLNKRESLIVSIHDVTELRSQAKELEKSELLSKIAFELTNSGTWHMNLEEDTESIITTPNLDKILGIDSSIQNKNLSTWTENILSTNKELGSKALQQLKDAISNPNARYDVDFQFTRYSDNKVIWLSGFAEIERDENGKATRLYGVSQDITDRKQQEQAILETQKNLDYALNAAHMGTFNYDRILGIIHLDDNAKNCLKITTNSKSITFNEWAELIHPEESQSVLTNLFSTSAAHKKQFTSTYRLANTEGGTRYVMTMGEVKYDDENNAIAITGLIWNITELKELELGYQDAKNRMEIAIDGSNMAMWDYNPITDRLITNDIFETMLGYPAGTFPKTKEKWDKLVYPEDLEQANRKVDDYLSGRTDEYRNEYRMRTIDGEPLWVLDVGKISSRNEQGEVDHFMGYHINITDMKVMQQNLERAKEEAEEANVAKSAFLANMSHEIRTPMNSIIGFSELLNKRINDPQSREFLQSIRSSGKTLLSLINDILDFSKIEAGQFSLQESPTNLKYTLNELSRIFEIRANEKNLNYTSNITGHLPTYVVIDELRIKQILTNFLGNALKFTSSGSIGIDVNCVENADHTFDIKFSVIDTGIGISKEDHAKVFEAFKQQDQQDNRKYGGTGLGLSISNSLTQLMGSQIEISSEKGKGSTFFFTLHNLHTGESNKADNDGIEEDVIFNNAKILVVDDLSNNRKIVSAYLKDKGLELYEAQDGVESIELAQKHVPDIILMDIRMPGMDGYEACKRLREIDSLKETKIVALTASVSMDDVQKINKCNFDSYIAKPVEEKVLINKMAKYIAYEAKPSEAIHKEVVSNFNTTVDDILSHKSIAERLNNECLSIYNSNQALRSSRNVKKLADALTKIGKEESEQNIEELGEQLKLAQNSYNIAKVNEIFNDLDILFNKV